MSHSENTQAALLKNFSVLYVEDDQNAQEWMQLVLQDDVKDFYQAFDGKEALELYKKYKPDIILTDINMPVLSGLEMAKIIKEEDEDVPVIVMSAFNDAQTLLEALNMGIDYFIPKPIDMKKLYKKLYKTARFLQNKKDAQKLKEQEFQELYQLAHYDPLTHVPNRLFFQLKLDQEVSKVKRHGGVFSLFFIDLDNFKQINDTYGHAAGDRVLEFFAKNVQEIVRIEDTFARISGDEFALLVEGVDDKNILDTMAQKILQASKIPIDFQGSHLSISCSIGIARFPHDADSKKTLLEAADAAMYRAKTLGKSQFAYNGE